MCFSSVLVLLGVPDFLNIFDTEIQGRKIKFWFCTKYWLFGIYEYKNYLYLQLLYYGKTGIFAAGAL